MVDRERNRRKTIYTLYRRLYKMQKRYNPAAEIINAIAALSDDPAVEWIIDAETGELLYMA